MDFLMNQAIIHSSTKFADIYVYMNSQYGIKYQDLFSICMSIGFKNNRKSKLKSQGIQIRSNYFNTNQRSAVYAMILEDPEIGKNIEKFSEKQFSLTGRILMEEYAEGGMEILVEEVFKNRWDSNRLDPSYNEYDVDILSYIYMDAQESPF